MKRWVVKAGSQLVCSGGPLLLRAWMQQVSELRSEHDIEVIWVTSGAIASAVDRTHLKRRKRDELSEKQALSAIGQPIVIDLYNLALHAVGLLGAQILLTYDDLSHAGRRKNFQNTIEKLLHWDVTPVLNENDAVATEEIKFGDNDSLSARVAQAVNADRLIILTDVDGLYDQDPKKNPRAKLLHEVKKLTPAHFVSVKPGAGSKRGTGGMLSKLKAAELSTKSGIETWLVRGDVPQALLQVVQNKKIGTVIRSNKSGNKGKKA